MPCTVIQVNREKYRQMVGLMEDLKEIQNKIWAKVKELRKQGNLPGLTEDDHEPEGSALANSQYRLSSDLGGFLGPQQIEDLIGRTFMYRGKYGLHEWTDTVSELMMIKVMNSQPGNLFSIISYQVEWQVRATRTNHIYPLKDIYFLD